MNYYDQAPHVYLPPHTQQDLPGTFLLHAYLHTEGPEGLGLRLVH